MQPCDIDRLRGWEIAKRQQEARGWAMFWRFVGWIAVSAVLWGTALHFIFPGPQ